MKPLIHLVLTALLAGAAAAQSPLFLEPERASVALGEQVRLTVVRADAPAPWPAERIGHFFARTAWTQENRDSVGPVEHLGSVAVWPSERPGVLLIGCDLEPALLDVEAATFAGFLGRSLSGARRAALGEVPADGQIALRHTESAKALLSIEADGAPPASIATSKTGQAVEIRPLMDPTALVPGSDFAVKIYARVEGAAGGVVTATNTTTGDLVRAQTDDVAIANIPIAAAGRWRVEFHAVAPPDEGDPDPRWTVHTATLTFEVAGEVNQ